MAFVTIPGGEGTEHDGPAMVDVTKQEMLDQYKRWEPDLITLLDVRASLLVSSAQLSPPCAVRREDFSVGDLSGSKLAHIRGWTRVPFR